MTNTDIVIDRATSSDIDFIANTIVEAEKSGTDNFGLANVFGIDEETMRGYIAEMLDEEIDGCEFSLSSFLVARHQGKPVASFAGWVEGYNEDSQPSSMLKSNLLSYTLPQECVLRSQTVADVVRSLQIAREKGTYQLEYSYTLPEYRGQGIMKDIINAHIAECQQNTSSIQDGGIKKMQVHVFANNPAAIRTYESCGFKIVKRIHSEEENVTQYFPDHTLLLMEMNI